MCLHGLGLYRVPARGPGRPRRRRHPARSRPGRRTTPRGTSRVRPHADPGTDQAHALARGAGSAPRGPGRSTSRSSPRRQSTRCPRPIGSSCAPWRCRPSPNSSHRTPATWGNGLCATQEQPGVVATRRCCAGRGGHRTSRSGGRPVRSQVPRRWPRTVTPGRRGLGVGQGRAGRLRASAPRSRLAARSPMTRRSAASAGSADGSAGGGGGAVRTSPTAWRTTARIVGSSRAWRPLWASAARRQGSAPRRRWYGRR
ncbi:hypothetical protein QFZ55_000188 [Streptomyces luteogriseus]|nr:hypothetical protein [Streptomyces luteogriseus]